MELLLSAALLLGLFAAALPRREREDRRSSSSGNLAGATCEFATSLVLRNMGRFKALELSVTEPVLVDVCCLRIGPSVCLFTWSSILEHTLLNRFFSRLYSDSRISFNSFDSLLPKLCLEETQYDATTHTGSLTSPPLACSPFISPWACITIEPIPPWRTPKVSRDTTERLRNPARFSTFVSVSFHISKVFNPVSFHNDVGGFSPNWRNAHDIAIAGLATSALRREPLFTLRFMVRRRSSAALLSSARCSRPIFDKRGAISDI
mmetsp:Transcript_87912/g.175859  ORF Transcript_87912/g.175859 Transcript_87912/m.175859 type:complete len:263 (-) Transcript_87912:87-875(-)